MAHNFLHRAAQRVGGGLRTTAQQTARFINPASRVRPQDVLRELPGAATQIFVGGPARELASIGLQLRKKTSVIPPRFLQPIVGNEPVRPFGELKRTTKTKEFLEKRGYSEKQARIGGLTVGFGLTALSADPTIFGSERKGAARGVEEAIQFAPDLAGAEKRIAAQIGKATPSFLSRALYIGKDVKSTFKSKIIDTFSPIADTVKKAGGVEKIINDPSFIRNRVLGSGSIADSMLRDGIEGTLRKVGAKNLERFNQYLVSRHAIDVGERGIKTGIDTKDAATLIRAHAPQFEEAAQEITLYTQRVLKYAQEGGLISRQTYNDLIKKYPNYVPLHRIFEEGEVPLRTGPKAIGSLGKQTVVQKLVGSERGIVAPLESIIEKTYQTVKEVEVNRTAREIARLRYLKDFKDIIKPVRTAEQVKERISLYSQVKELRPIQKKIESVLRSQGKSMRKLKTELNRLNRKAILLSLKKSRKEPITVIAQLKKITIPERVQFAGEGSEEYLAKFTSKQIRYEILPSITRLRGEVSTKKTIEAMIQDPNVHIEHLKGLIGRREPKLQTLLGEIQEMKSRFERVRAIRGTLIQEARKLKDISTQRPTINVFNDGILEVFEVPKEFEEAAKRLGVQSMNILSKMASVPVRSLRLGATGINPGFILSNFIRDVQTSLITSDPAFRASIFNPFNFIASFFDVIRQGGAYQDFMRSGGGSSQFVSVLQGEAALTAKELARRPGQKIINTITNPTQWIRQLENLVSIAEKTTRVAQFRGTRKALGAKGPIDVFAAPTEAGLRALQQGRENTVDFAKSGAWGPVLNSTFVYLNSGIQGSRLLLRTFRQRPMATTFTVATSLYMPVALTTMWNLATPERRKAYMDIPDWERNNNLIVLPPNPKIDTEGNYTNAFKIPLPQGFSSLAIPIRAGIEHLAGADQSSMKEILLSTLSGITTVNFGEGGELASRMTPTAILPMVEQYTNTKLFTGAPLVPKKLVDLPPAMQTKKGIAASVEMIGKATGMSPIVLQNYIASYTGGVGLEVLNAIDRGLAIAGVIEPEDIGGKGIIEDIQNRLLRAKTGRLEREEYDIAGEYKQKAAARKYEEDQTAQSIYQELQAIPRDQWRPKLLDLKNQGVLSKEVYKRIKDIDKLEESGATGSDRFIKSLPVQERAEYILDKLGDLPREQQRPYLIELKKKGILSRNVYDGLLERGYEPAK